MIFIKLASFFSFTYLGRIARVAAVLSCTGNTVVQTQPHEARRKTSISEKAACSRAAQKRLSDAEIRLAGVKARIRSATIAGHIVASRQLDDAQRAVDANLEAAKTSLEHLRKCGETGWKERARDVDNAWEHLSLSIKRLVAGYSDGSK